MLPQVAARDSRARGVIGTCTRQRRGPFSRARVTLMLASSALVLSCTKERIIAVDVVTVTVAPPGASVLVGDSVLLSASVQGDRGGAFSDAEVTWTSSD